MRTHRVFIAPMAGVTDAAFREIASGFHPRAITTTEMVPAAAQAMFADRKKRNPRIEHLFRPIGTHPTIVQIFGADPAQMAKSARINETLGADGIDINMGCPMPKIVSNGSGAALMKNPRLAAEIVGAVKKAVKVPVSAKMRTGWDASSANAPELAKMLEDAGADLVAVHGRTRAQMYEGEADYAAIAAVKRAVKIPVIANGSVTSGEGAREMLDKTGADGVMIGRGALGRPWIGAQIATYLETGRTAPDPAGAELREIVLKHLALMVELYGERPAALIAKKHLCWYARAMRGAAEFRRSVTAASTAKEMTALAEDYF
ncbi:MAG: tRNA dihydrouridine synthase DusB [Rickettsiales bacterium]|jgi:tRNA-dihydrouridine synthase B|nr:tRNA dihydrouridine synthase DusB [Rickettsiales bacterium]